MFPIKDHNPSGRFPFVTYALIAVNCFVFLFHWPLITSQMDLAFFYSRWALFPVAVTHGEQIHTIVTSMFLHGSFMHILGNMLFLFIFGDNMEDQLGHTRYLLFYLASGVAAALLQIIADPMSQIPMVGASGAIAGVMGGYLLLFPKARVDILIILIIIFRVITIPAWIVLGLWFAMQVFGGVGTPADQGGVAYWAHIGGFVAGLLLTIPYWRSKGGTAYWSRTHGQPPHDPLEYRWQRTNVPQVRRRR